MNQTLTTSSGSIGPRRRSEHKETATDYLKTYGSVIAIVLIFGVLVLSSVTHGNLFLADLLTVGFIILCITVLKTVQPEVHSSRIRASKRKS